MKKFLIRMPVFILVPTASKSSAIPVGVEHQSLPTHEMHLLMTHIVESFWPISLVGAKSHTIDLLGSNPDDQHW